jgi:hypothetical protein
MANGHLGAQLEHSLVQSAAHIYASPSSHSAVDGGKPVNLTRQLYVSQRPVLFGGWKNFKKSVFNSNSLAINNSKATT